MTVFWALIAIAGLVAAAVALGRHATRHRPRYIDTAAWKEAHWRDEHEKARVAQERMLEDHL